MKGGWFLVVVALVMWVILPSEELTFKSQAGPSPPRGTVVGVALIRSGNFTIEIKIESLEILSLLKLIKRLAENRSILGGEVRIDSGGTWGFSFDPSSIYIYNDYVPELTSSLVVFSEPTLARVLTIPEISGNLVSYTKKICYVRLHEVIDLRELVLVRSDARWRVVSKVTATGSATSPSLAQDTAGRFWVAYVSDLEIYVVSSIDCQEWSSPIRVGQPLKKLGASSAPSLICDKSGVLRLAYQSGESVVTCFSTDGSKWSETRVVTEGRGPSLYQDSKGIFLLVLSDDEPSICLSNSRDFETWSSFRRLSKPDGSPYQGWNPQLLEDQKGVYWIAYTSLVSGGGNRLGVYLISSSDGASWSDPFLALETGTDEFSFMQDSSKAYWIAFHTRVSALDSPSPLDDGNANIFVADSIDGRAWEISGAARVTDDPANDIEPSILQDFQGNYWVAFASWKDGSYDIFLATRGGCQQVSSRTTAMERTTTTSTILPSSIPGSREVIILLFVLALLVIGWKVQRKARAHLRSRET